MTFVLSWLRDLTWPLRFVCSLVWFNPASSLRPLSVYSLLSLSIHLLMGMPMASISWQILNTPELCTHEWRDGASEKNEVMSYLAVYKVSNPKCLIFLWSILSGPFPNVKTAPSRVAFLELPGGSLTNLHPPSLRYFQSVTMNALWIFFKVLVLRSNSPRFANFAICVCLRKMVNLFEPQFLWQ